jgi:LuxR family transcriptional activator of conjugal transfer of Ti plasmids
LPSKAFDRLRDTLETAEDAPSMKVVLKDLAGQLGFDWFAYLSVRGTEIETLSNYPQCWQHAYISSRYAAIDPVVREAKKSEWSFAWSEGAFPQLSADQTKVLGEAREHGIASGTTVSIRAGFGRRVLFTLASSDSGDDCLVRCPLFAGSIASHIDVHIRSRSQGLTDDGSVRLTSKEKVCLIWAENGKATMTLPS